MKNITYRQVGDYLIPNIKLAEEDEQPIDKYCVMRKDYLYNNKRVYFNILLMKGELTKHLLSVQHEAEELLACSLHKWQNHKALLKNLK